MQKIVVFLLTTFLIVIVAACQTLNPSDSGSVIEPTEAIPTAAQIVTRDLNDDLVDKGTPSPSGNEKYTLNVWVDSPIDIEDGKPGAALLKQQITTFDASHPDVTIDIQLKQIAGAGGSLDYLRTGRNVADNVLPDIILLPVELVPVAAADQLIYPLDGLLSADTLYNAPTSLSMVDGALYGYPIITTGLQHAVYTNNILDSSVPVRWDELVSNEQVRLVFAGDSVNSATLLLVQYLASGGQLSSPDDAFTLQTGPLTKALGRISAGTNSGTLLSISAETTTSNTALSTLQQGIANSAIVAASDYMLELRNNSAYTFGPIPGGDSSAAQFVSTWVWAIATPNTIEQQLSAEFITFITSPENLGAWTAETNLLPANPEAFTAWPDDSYTSFLKTQLSATLPNPQNMDSETALILQQAVTDLIENGGDVTTLADEIIGRIEQK